MFFDNVQQIPSIAQRTSCTIFVVPKSAEIELKHALILHPAEDKKSSSITVEQMRDFLALTNSRETSDRYFIISPADAMNEAAENAFLKTLEEPKTFCHFVLITEHPAMLLPTILSRAQIFFLKTQNQLSSAPTSDPKVLALAKKMISASPLELIEIATELSKNKTKPREQALEVVSTVIELLYKSYFKTGNTKFLAKLPNFIKLHENLTNNGHLKLHLVADLL